MMLGIPEVPGLRRVGWVRVVLHDGGGAGEVFGVGHRRPASRPVSLTTAAALAARGVPVVIRDRRSETIPFGKAG